MKSNMLGKGLLLVLALMLVTQSVQAEEQEKFAGKEFRKATTNPEDNPDLSNVLIIGDSISLGYTVDVRKLLYGKADVFRVPTNCRNSAYGVENVAAWLKEGKYDVIHFNWGLWDLCYRHPESKNQGKRDKVNGTVTATPEEFGENLKKIVTELKKTDAKLIWCNITPVPENEAGRKVGDDLIYNRIAAEIMQANDIKINDLHAHALKKLPGIASAPGNVHYTPAGSAYLAEKVAEEIAAELPKQK